MPTSSFVRASVAFVALVGVAACATEPQSAMNSGADARPTEFKTIELSEDERRRLSRELQLQTPVSLTPEDTGAPSPGFFANGSEIGHNELVAGGVDVEPRLRVWQRWPQGVRQIYGPQPSLSEPIVRPGVVVSE